MARVTVEDCIKKVPNRFELILLAGQRAKNINAGDPITLPRDRDKNSVVALREIEEGTVNPEDLNNMLIASLQKHLPAQDMFETNSELQEAQAELSKDDAYAQEALQAMSQVVVDAADVNQADNFQVTEGPEE